VGFIRFPSERPAAKVAGTAAVVLALAATVAGLGGKGIGFTSPVAEPQGQAPVADRPGCPNSGQIPEAGRLGRAEATTLCLLNLERAGRGLAPFTADSRLHLAAARHSRDMAERDFYDHESPEGATPSQRMAAVGYPLMGATAENIHWGVGTRAAPVRIVEDWMDSPGHRANILNPRLTLVGVGVADGAAKPHTAGRAAVYTTDFGGPA
jgi:uncharacterized protein YkwD